MKTKTTISIRLIEDNTVHWYGIRGDLRFDHSTWVHTLGDNPMEAVIRAEGGENAFKQLLTENFNYREAEIAGKQEDQRLLPATPTQWTDVTEFTNWWLKTRPMRVPFDAEVICSDDTTGLCIYREGQYQVEMYMSHPGEMIQQHAHPGVEVILVKLGGGKEGELMPDGSSSLRFKQSGVLRPGEYHGADEVSPSRGYLVFEKWDEWLGTPTSTAIQWKGPPAGPKHEKIVNLIEHDSI